MAVTSLLKPRSIARKALSFYIQKAGSNQGAAFDFITYLAEKLYKVLVSSTDEEANYLEDKITASGFSEVEINTDIDGIQTLNINSEADIGDLNDVVITDIQNGDVLAYDAETQNFINTQKSDKNDMQLQSTPALVWVCNHGLSKYVSISTFDGVTGKRIYGIEEQSSTDTTTITFNHLRWGWWTAN